MNRTWLISILALSMLLLLLLKTYEKRALAPYFKGERSLQLRHFQEAKSRVTPNELTLLELWESMLTGRVAPLDRWLRQEYKTLALAHVFTPSGFHLSAILWPVMFFLRKRRHKVGLLSFIGAGLLFLPGQSALKRMTLVKLQQQFFGMKTGFLMAMVLDIFWGSFSGCPLGFTYSFLFLGIIYSGAKGVTIVVWFFIAQVMIAFIQGSLISPLLLLISPVINFVLALILPFLFLFAWPLWGWQLSIGLWLLKFVQGLVSFSYSVVMNFPLLEVNIVLLIFFLLLACRQARPALIMCFLFTADLNTDIGKIKLAGRYEWQAQGKIIKVEGGKIYRTDGICKRDLVKGIWFENCSPRGRSSRNKKT